MTPSSTSRRRMTLRAVTGLALATTLALGAAGTAQAAPATPATTTARTAALAQAAAATPTTTVVAPAYINSANVSQVVVSGVTAAGNTIALTGKDSGNFLTAKTVTATPTVGSNGSWSATLDTSSLADGTVTWTATPSTGTTAGTAATTTSTKDTSAPSAPATVTASPAPYVGTGSLTVSGTTAMGDSDAATVDVTITDIAGHTISSLNQTVTPSTSPIPGLGSGSFSVVFTATQMATLSDGTITISALFHDAAGNAGPATKATDETGKLKAVGVSPAEGSTVSSPSTVSITFNQKLSSSGTGTTSTIGLKDSTGTAVAGTSSVSGDSVVFTPSASLPDGTYTASATVYDAAYTSETASDSFAFTVSVTAAPTPPVIKTFTDPINAANQTTVTVAGTADQASQPVTVKIGSLTKSVTPGTDRSWTTSFDVTSLADGTLTATATQTGTSGKTSQAATATSTKDTVAPKLVQAAPADGSTVITAKQVGFAFAENLASGSIKVTAMGTSAPVAGTSSVSGAKVLFTPTTTLANGTYTAAATVADAAGNPATASSTFTVDSNAVTSSTTLNTSSAAVVRGSSVTLSGAVTLSSGTASGSVDLMAQADSSSSPVDLGPVSLASDGTFTVTFTPPVGATYQAFYSGGNGTTASSSPQRHVSVAVKVRASTRTGKHTVKAVVNGSTTPRTSGVLVTLYRLQGGRYVRLATTHTSSGGFTLRATLPKGTSQLAVTVAKTADNAAGSVKLTARRT